MRKIILLIGYILCNTAVLGQTALQYRLDKDEVFTIRQEAEQIITQELEGTTHEIRNTIDGILEFKVLGAQEDNYVVQFMFKDLNLRMVSNLQGELMNVHAGQVNQNDVQSQVFHSLLNSPIRMTLSPLGDILEVRGGDSLVVKMVEASGLEDEFSMDMLKKRLEKDFGSEALSNSYEQMTFIYPDQAVTVGDSWQNEYCGSQSVKNTWVLEALGESHTEITGVAEVSVLIEDINASMKLAGTQKTRITADPKTGFVRHMKVEGMAKGTGIVAELGEQEIPTTIKSIITYDLINKKYVP